MRSDSDRDLRTLMDDRIALLDGAMGTTLREYGLDESAARGERFRDASKDLLNNGDILSLTQPEVIGDMHKRFLEAGCDLVETNTFSATTVSQSEFFVEDPRERGERKDPEFFQGVLEDPFLQDLTRDLNLASTRLAREEANRSEEETGRRRYVAGSIGPLTVSLTNAPDHDDPAFRVITFDQVKEAYRQQIDALMQGDCDLLILETIFDSLNAKAAAVAMQELFAEQGRELPVIISAAVGRGGETMISAQKIEAFCIAFHHLDPLAIGLNCSLGPDLMRPFLAQLSQVAESYVSCYPNAGLPNPLAPTGFDLEPHHMAEFMAEFAQAGFLNLAGGCCGNTPAHLAAIAEAVKPHAPRPLPVPAA